MKQDKRRARLSSRSSKHARNKGTVEAASPRSTSSVLSRDLLVWATVAVAVATFVMVGIAYLQVRALWQSDQTARTTNKAIVVLDEVLWTAIKTKDGSPGWIVTPRWLNSGNTATANLRIDTACPNAFTPVHDPIQIIGFKKISMARFLGPKQTTLGGGCSFKNEALIKVQNKEAFLYVWTKATYEDEFGEPHVTESCLLYTTIIGDVTNHETVPARILRHA